MVTVDVRVVFFFVLPGLPAWKVTAGRVPELSCLDQSRFHQAWHVSTEVMCGPG